MKRDAKWFLKHGADGIVFGILRYRKGVSSIAREPCQELVALAGARDAVFHRAFDFLPEPLLALEELAELGFQRVQSSGGYATAEGGIGRLTAWVAHAGWQIEIVPAGGINPSTVLHLLRETQAHSVHGSFRAAVADPSLTTNPGLMGAMGATAPEGNWRTTSADMVRAMRSALDHLAEDQDGAEEDEEQ
jgi:copper homeostasis protein